MAEISSDNVRAFLVGQYADQLRGKGFDPGVLPDDFDFLLKGVIDSLSVLQMVGNSLTRLTWPWHYARNGSLLITNERASSRVERIRHRKQTRALHATVCI